MPVAVLLGTVFCLTDCILASVPDAGVGGVPDDVAGPWWIWMWLLAALVILYVLISLGVLRLNNLPRFPWNFRSGMGLLFFAAALIAGMFGHLVGWWITGPPPSEIIDDQTAATTLQVMTIVHFCGLLATGVVLLSMPGWWHRRSPGQADRRPGILGAVLWGTLAFLVVLPMVIGTTLLFHAISSWFTGEPANPLGHQVLIALVAGRDSPWFWSTVVLVVVGAPVVEEVLYRGLLQESLRRHRVLMGASPWSAIVCASLFFTVMHLAVADWQGLPGLFLLSLGLGWVFTRTGRLAAPITMHMLFNGLNIYLAT